MRTRALKPDESLWKLMLLFVQHYGERIYKGAQGYAAHHTDAEQPGHKCPSHHE